MPPSELKPPHRVFDASNKEVHRICGELGFTHYENLVNLHLLVGRGRFRFIGLPLKIRGGTGLAGPGSGSLR